MEARKQEVQVRFELSKDNGYLAVYARFAPGKIHNTYEVRSGVAADVDAAGQVLAVEIIKTFSTKAKKIKFEGMINLKEIQEAVEKRFKVSLEEEFSEIRAVTAAVAN